MPRAVKGSCPWATARLVTTPAPRQATAIWLVISLFGLGVGVTRAEASGGTLPAVLGSGLKRALGCYRLCGNFMLLLHQLLSAAPVETARHGILPLLL